MTCVYKHLSSHALKAPASFSYLHGGRCHRSGLTFQDEARAAAIKALDLDWICNEVEWLSKQLSAEANLPEGRTPTPGDSPSATESAKRFLSEVVLCHNDLLSGNVLHAEGWDRVQVRKREPAHRRRRIQ